MDCPPRGQFGQGNIRIHSRKRARYRCSVRRQTFSDRTGTPFFRRRTAETTITCVLTLIGNGYPIPAIEAACATSGVSDLVTFAAGLQREYKPVRSALELPYSTGPVEGHVNRIKVLKRQGYGRAKFDLLRQRVLLAA